MSRFSLLFVLPIAGLVPAGLVAQGPPKGGGTDVVLESGGDGVPLPDGALHRFGNRRARHPDGIIASAISPDGKLLATVGNRSVIVWDVQTMVAKCILRDQNVRNGYQDGGPRVAFFPDSKRLLVAVQPDNNLLFLGQMDNPRKVDVARVFDADTGKLRFAVQGNPDYWASAWLAAGGKEIAVYAQQAVTYHDARDGKELRRVACGPDLNGLLAVAPDAHLAVFRRNDRNTLALVDVATGKHPDQFTVESFARVALSPDGKRLAAVDGSHKIHVRDVEAKKELVTFAQPATNGVAALHFSADQQTLYFGGQYGRLYRWDLKANKKLPDVGQHSSWNLTGFTLSPDESELYSTGHDRLVRRWDLKAGKELPLPEGYITQTAVVPLPDRKTLLVADHQGALDLWDLVSGRHLRRFQGQKSGGIDCVAVSADGRWFAGGRTMQDVTLWDLKAGQFRRIIPLVEKPDPKGSDHVRRVAFNPAGTVLYTGSGKTGVTAWEVPTGKKLWNAPGVGPYLAVDPKGRWVAAGGGFNQQQVQWTQLSAATGEVVRRVDVVPGGEQPPNGPPGLVMSHYPAYVSDLRFTPDGSRLLTAHYDGTVRLWDPAEGREVGRLTGTGQGSGLAVSPDGRWVGVGQTDYKITVWELASRKQVLTLTGHDSAVRDVAFTPTGRGIVGNADLAPILWTLETHDPAKADAAAWEVLASPDGAKAYRVQWALIKDPAGAVKLFTEKVKPAELALERARFDRWVADLDSPRFKVREAAEQELTKAGMRVPLGWLRKALADSTSDETRARLGRVLAEREKPNPDEWRLDRAVQVLELAGTPEAVDLLKSWAAVDGSPVTEASRGAVERLGRR